MSNIISWQEKALCIFSFAVAAHNATWNNKDTFVRVGGALGGGIVMSFAVECALKAMLEKNRIQPKKIHNLYSLFNELPQDIQAKLAGVYGQLLAGEKDKRVHTPPINSLGGCLKHHDNAFKEWRYEVKGNSKFYPVLMTYVCASLLTNLTCMRHFINPLQFPEKNVEIASSTSYIYEILDGDVKERQ